jgi:hypothetical protein
MMMVLRRLAFPALLLPGFLLAVMPFFQGPAPPMTDFCQHALVAQMMNHLEDTQLNYQAYFTRDSSYRTMYVAQLLLSLLEHFGGAIQGARLFLVLFVALLYLGTYTYLRALGIGPARWIALGTLPYAFSWPVYSGLLPYVMTFPLFTFLLAWWAGRPSSATRTVVAAMILVLMHGVHLLGAVGGAIAIAAWSLAEAFTRKPSGNHLKLDLLTVVPVTALVLAIYAMSPPGGHLVYKTPLTHVKAYLGFNCGSLAELVLPINFAGLVGLGCALVLLGRRGALHPGVAGAAFALALVGFVAPTDMVRLWPAGPRLLPYAILTAFGLLRLERRGVILFVLATMSIVAGDALATSGKIRALEGPYRDFLSGQDRVPYGAKLLPIVVDPHAGSRHVDPFWSLFSYYTITRGGAHPYAYAYPTYRNQASPLSYRNRDVDFPYAFFYKPEARPEDYRGVSNAYDVVLLWGRAPGIARVLEEEMDLDFEQGDLRLYRPRRPRTRDAVSSRSATPSPDAKAER